MAKSTMVVVPPMAAARVPVRKSSAELVPPKGMSRCVCASMPPGRSNNPVASTTVCTELAGIPGRTSLMMPASMSTSARALASALTTVAFWIRTVGIGRIPLISHTHENSRTNTYSSRLRTPAIAARTPGELSQFRDEDKVHSYRQSTLLFQSARIFRGNRNIRLYYSRALAPCDYSQDRNPCALTYTALGSPFYQPSVDKTFHRG